MTIIETTAPAGYATRDREVAAIYASIFLRLAADPSDEHKAIARGLWSVADCYDYSEREAEVEAALAALDVKERSEP